MKNHCKLVEGRKVISENAFSVFSSKTVEPNVDIDTQLVANLWDQIREKDHQIETLGNQLNENDLQITRRDEQISELTKAFREAQTLHAGTLQRELSDSATTVNDKHRWWQFWHKKIRTERSILPEICIFLGIRITMHYSEHNPPHFHARYGDFSAVVSILDSSILSGFLPNKQLKIVLAWAQLKQDELMQNWELMKNRKEPNTIKPIS